MKLDEIRNRPIEHFNVGDKPNLSEQLQASRPISPSTVFRTSETLPRITTAHSHTCNCGDAFVCEGRCRPDDEQHCEHCEVWSMSHGRSTNKQKLADYLDDQVIIEQVRLQAVQKEVAETLSKKGGQ